MEFPVRKDKPVDAEILITQCARRTKITSIGPELLFFFIFLEKSLIDPIPDKTSLELSVFIEIIPVILEISNTVAHGMGILAQD